MEKNELHALLKLLDDSDEEVVQIVENKLLESGDEILPDLEEAYLSKQFEDCSNQIELILKLIQRKALHSSVNDWLLDEQRNTLQAWVLASRVQYPGLSESLIKAHLNRIKIDAWVKLSGVGNPLDQIQILNHVIFKEYGFSGNNTQYHSPDNSLITRVMETKKGNPISLAMLYLQIANSLGIPLFGVNLPQHFILAYGKLHSEMNPNGFYDPEDINLRNFNGKVLFYLNPFSKGQIFAEESIDSFLKVIKVEKQTQFYQPCSPIDIFKRVLRNLHFAYGDQHDSEKQHEIEALMKIVGIGSEI
jgi:regulator of sirC expression with transglutaminase-like and TPR domain